MLIPLKSSYADGSTMVKPHLKNHPFEPVGKGAKHRAAVVHKKHSQGAETRDFAMFITDTEVAVGAGELMLGLWRGCSLKFQPSVEMA